MHPTDRKKQLIAQGALYRAEVLVAKHSLEAGLRPDALARGLINHAVVTAAALFSKSSGMPAGLKLQSMLPLVLSGLSALSRKTSGKPLLRGALIAALTAGAAAFIAKKQADASVHEHDIGA